MRKIVVTGAAGFIGSSLVDHLLGNPENFVVGVDCLTEYYDQGIKQANVVGALASGRFELRRADICTLDLDAVLADTEIIYHQAGQPGVRSSWGVQFEEYVHNNVLTTQILLEASRNLPSLRRFVYASSSSIYGDAAKYPSSEEDRPTPLSPYGVTKLAGENLCVLYANNFGVPTVSLRYFTVYGPRQRPDMAFQRFLSGAASGGVIRIFGDGRQRREFTYISDIVLANQIAGECDLPPGVVMNLSGGETVSVNDVLGAIENIVGLPLDVVYSDGVAGDVRQTGGTVDRASRLMGWKPQVPLSDGLRLHYESVMHGRTGRAFLTRVRGQSR